jgi:hypothetical protein
MFGSKNGGHGADAPLPYGLFGATVPLDLNCRRAPSNGEVTH